jgi:hypothetical protein
MALNADSLWKAIFTLFIWVGLYQIINDVIETYCRTRGEKTVFRISLFLIGVVLLLSYENNGDCAPKDTCTCS